MAAYNQKRISVLIDGVAQQELTEGDSVVVSQSQDTSSITPPGVGATRGTTSIANGRTGTITLTYKSVSPSLKLIRALQIAQQEGVSLPIDILINDPSGVVVNAFGCSIQNQGDITTGGPQHGTQAVVFGCERIDTI